MRNIKADLDAVDQPVPFRMQRQIFLRIQILPEDAVFIIPAAESIRPGLVGNDFLRAQCQPIFECGAGLQRYDFRCYSIAFRVKGNLYLRRVSQNIFPGAGYAAGPLRIGDRKGLLGLFSADSHRKIFRNAVPYNG